MNLGSSNSKDCQLRTFFFDLDNTLYPHSAGVTEALEAKMNAYVADLTNTSIPDATLLRQGYYHQYGTTLRGLQLHHRVDTEAYLAAVHHIPIETLVIPNPSLCIAMKPWLGQSAVFTNSPREHAERVLAVLGFGQNTIPIIDIRAIAFHPKPHINAYQHALQIMRTSAQSAVLFEDTLVNLEHAKAFGFRTIYLQSPDATVAVPNYVDAVYQDIVTAIVEECH
jgi:putative hydrolase of the HAD superfamily